MDIFVKSIEQIRYVKSAKYITFNSSMFCDLKSTTISKYNKKNNIQYQNERELSNNITSTNNKRPQGDVFTALSE